MLPVASATGAVEAKKEIGRAMNIAFGIHFSGNQKMS